MKLVRNTLIGLYANLFSIIFLIVGLLRGAIKRNMGSLTKGLLIGLAIITSVLCLILAIINIINTCSLYKNKDYNSLRKSMKTLKLGMIPYFILNFLFYLLLALLFFAASRGMIIFTPIPILLLVPVFFTYLTVLFTSCYGMGFIAIINKENRINSGKMIIHILFQLCFVLDVISTIILLNKYKAE